MKNVVILALAGALVGIVIASVVVPPALSWYSTPGGLPKGVEIQALVQIPEVIRYTTSKLLRAQALGAAAGAVVGVLAGIALHLRDRSSAPARA